MLNFFLSLLIGWPTIIITVILALIGLLRSDYRFLVAAAILAFPFSLVLGGFPMISIWPPIFLLPLLPFFSGFAMSRKHEMTAWLLAIPYFLVVVLVLLAALASGS